MLLGAFDEFSRHPILGGHSARGCGEVEMTLRVLRGDEVLMTIEVGGFTGSRAKPEKMVSVTRETEAPAS